MKQGPDEQLNTPLEDALLNLPQEEAPERLQGACMAAIAEARPTARPHWEAWRQLAVAAAVIVLLVGVGNLTMMRGAREKARQPEPAQFMLREGASMASPGAPGAAMSPPPPPPAAAGPAAGMAGRAATKSSVGALSMASKPAARDALGYNGIAQEGMPTTAGPPGPWNDQSEERRKVTQRSVEVETPTVEETYKQAVGLIERAGGYLTHEELVVLDRGQDHAQLQARIPVEQFDGLIAQVRELGHLVRMTGQSEDKTEDYQAQGADIRTLGAREEDLAARYNSERNSARKEQLRLELQSVRQQLAAEKASLKSLHKETSWAQLSLEISETRGVRQFINRAAQEALPLAFSLALIAVPLLVLALLWKRRGN